MWKSVQKTLAMRLFQGSWQKVSGSGRARSSDALGG